MSPYFQNLQRYDDREKKIKRGQYPSPDQVGYAEDMANYTALRCEQEDPEVRAFLEGKR